MTKYACPVRLARLNCLGVMMREWRESGFCVDVDAMMFVKDRQNRNEGREIYYGVSERENQTQSTVTSQQSWFGQHG
jgi:hypothetical protein